MEPDQAVQVLDWIGAIYAVEARICDQQLTWEAKRAMRQEQAKPVVEKFFRWIGRSLKSRVSCRAGLSLGR